MQTIFKISKGFALLTVLFVVNVFHVTSVYAQAEALPEAHRGKIGEWVRGNNMDIRVVIVKQGELELPQIDFKNHSEHGIDIMPCYIRAEYWEGKVMESTEPCDGSGMVVAPKGTLTGFDTISWKYGPKVGRLKSVELLLGKRPELQPERFILE